MTPQKLRELEQEAARIERLGMDIALLDRQHGDSAKVMSGRVGSLAARFRSFGALGVDVARACDQFEVRATSVASMRRWPAPVVLRHAGIPGALDQLRRAAAALAPATAGKRAFTDAIEEVDAELIAIAESSAKAQDGFDARIGRKRDEFNRLVRSHRAKVDAAAKAGEITDEKEIAKLHGSSSSRGRADVYSTLERVGSQGDAEQLVKHLEGDPKATRTGFAKNYKGAPKTAAADGKAAANNGTAEQAVARASIQYGGYAGQDSTSVTIGVTPDFHHDKKTTSHAATDKQWRKEQNYKDADDVTGRSNRNDRANGGKPDQGEWDWNHYSGQKTTQGGIGERTSDYKGTSAKDYDIERIKLLPLRDFQGLPRKYKVELLKQRNSRWFTEQLLDLSEPEAKAAGQTIHDLWKRAQSKKAADPTLKGSTQRAQDAQDALREKMRAEGKGLEFGRYSPKVRRTVGRDIGDVRARVAEIDRLLANPALSAADRATLQDEKKDLQRKLTEDRQLASHGRTSSGHDVRTTTTILNTSFHPTGPGRGEAEFAIALSGRALQRAKSGSASTNRSTFSLQTRTTGGETTTSEGVVDTMLLAHLELRTHSTPGAPRASGANQAGAAAASTYKRSLAESLAFNRLVAADVAARTSVRAEALARALYAGLHTHEEQGRGRNQIDMSAVGTNPQVKRADSLVPIGRALMKKRGEKRASLADDIAQRRTPPPVEAKLVAQLERLSAATAEARPLVSKDSQALQAAVARLDAQLAGLKGARGRELASGARGVGVTLGQMASIARQMNHQSAGTVRAVQALVNQRRDQLARLASGLSPDGKAGPREHRNLDELGRQVPGLEKVVGEKKKRGRRGDEDASDPQGRKGAKNTRSRGRDDEREEGGLAALGRGRRGRKGKGRGGRKTAALERAHDAYMKKGRGGLVDVVAPGAQKLFGGLGPAVNKLFEALKSKGHKPRARGWWDSIKSGVSKVKSGISDIKQGVAGGLAAAAKKAVQYSPLGLAVKAGNAAYGLAKAVAQSGPAKSLVAAVKSGASKATSLAKAAVNAGVSKVKSTAKALGHGMKQIYSRVAHAASHAWDSTKHALKTVGNGALSAAKKTGGWLKSAWNKTTGVVGAIGGKIKSGLSSAASWVGDKAKKVGGALMGAAKWAGGKIASGAKWAGNAFMQHHPLGKALKFGWDKFGKNAWDKTKSFASAAWDGAKKIGKAAGNFLQSPAGQLLTTGLSIAATFIPGGMLVKAAIGAAVGAIEAVAKGGGLKEALMGAAMGGLEGALPFMKLGVVGKLAIGGVKGGLGAAINGGGIGDIAKGALGGAFDVGGMALFKKIGGGRGIKAINKFMMGGGKYKGVLGGLQKVAQKAPLQKLYKGVTKIAPKIVKGAVWAYDKTGKLGSALDVVHAGGEAVQGALQGVSGFTTWAKGKLPEDSAFGAFLGKVGDLSGKGAEKLGTGLEYVKKVDEVVDTAHDYLGKGLKVVGVNPDRAVKQMKKKQELQRKHAGKLKNKPDVFDRIDNWGAKKGEKLAARRDKLKGTVDRQVKTFKKKLGSSEHGRTLIKGGKKLVQAGVWTYAQLGTLKDVIEKGVSAGEQIQQGLQNLVLLTEHADEDALGGSLKWINETAAEWEGKLNGGLELVKQVQGVVTVGHGALGQGLKYAGRKDEDLEAAEKKSKTWWGLEKPEEGEKTVSSFGRKKLEDGEVAVAPWVKLGEKANEKLLGSEENPTRLKNGLERLDKWREAVKKGATVVGKHNTVTPEDDEAKKNRINSMNAGLRLLGGEAGDLEEDWEAYKERQKAAKEEAEKKKKAPAAEPKAAKGELEKGLGDGIGRKLDEVGTKEAKDVEKQERELGDGGASSGAPEQTIVDPGRGPAAAGGDAIRDGAPPIAAEGPDLDFDALAAKIDALGLRIEAYRAMADAGMGDDAERASIQTEIDLLLADVNGREARALIDGRDSKPWRLSAAKLRRLQAQLGGGAKGAVADGAQAGGETAPNGLGQMATADGIAGGKEPARPGLELLSGYGQGFSNIDYGANRPENDVVFERLNDLLDEYEERIRGDLPRLEHMVGADPENGKALYDALVREGRRSEFEIERLGAIVGADRELGQGLAALVQRYLSLRRGVEIGQSNGAAGAAEGGATEGQPAPGAEASEDAALLDGGNAGAEAGGDAGGGAPAAAAGGAAPGAGKGGKGGAAGGEDAPGADEGYLGETFEDTWIGSGAAARPIGEGLASNFKFDDENPAGPSVGGELAKLGGAIMGLGGSLAGAAGDLGEIADEVKLGAAAAGGIGADIGELVGAKDNWLTDGAKKVGEFADKAKEETGAFAETMQRVGKYGGELHTFGSTWKEKGFKKAAGDAIGKAFKKSKKGGEDTGPAPIVSAGSYAEAPRRLDYSISSQMERFLGSRFGDVKIHTGAGAEQITKRFDAEAVTIREHIFFAPGRFQPESTEGRKLIAHELTHVAQRNRPNLDTRTAEAEAHKAEAAFGAPGMEMLDLSTPQADFTLNMGGAEHNPNGIRTAKKTRSVSGDSASADDGVEGEELLDLVGERVYELLIDDLEKDFENR